MRNRFIRTSFLTVVAGATGISVAAAQPADEVVSEGEPAAAPSVAQALEEPGGGSAWPQEIIMRPLTLPAGVWAAGLDPAADKGFDTVTTAVGFGYGITDTLEASIGYGLALEEFEAKGDVEVGVGYAFYREGKFELVARGGVGYSLLAEGLTPLSLGVQGQYTHNDKLAIVMPAGQLSVALASEMDVRPVALALPIGVGFQPTSSIYTQVDTTLASIGISDADTVVFGADIIPLNVGAFYSPSNSIDVGAGVSTDLKETDATAFFALFRYYGVD